MEGGDAHRLGVGRGAVGAPSPQEGHPVGMVGGYGVWGGTWFWGLVMGRWLALWGGGREKWGGTFGVAFGGCPQFGEGDLGGKSSPLEWGACMGKGCCAPK